MKILLLIICLVISSDVFSQTFKVSDIKITGDISYEKIQKTKLKALNAKVKLTFYDNSIRVTAYGESNREDKEEYVLNKIKPNEYQSIVESNSYRRRTVTLKLNALLSYVTSAILEIKDDVKVDYGSCSNYKEEASTIVTLKRN